MSDSQAGGPFRMPDLIKAETGELLPQQEAYLYLIRAARALGGPVGAMLEAHGLSGKQYNALRSIRRAGSGGATINDIRQQMTDARADVSRLIDRLVRDGLVLRKEDVTDRRVVRVVLSKTGENLLTQIDEPLLAIHRSQFGRLNPADLERLKELLKQVI